MKKHQNKAIKQVAHSTGPISQEGKAISSKNATTKGIFAKGYLPWEDPAEQAALVQGLVQVWEVDQHPERMTFIRDIEESDLRLSRAMNYERMQIEAAMQSLDVAYEFSQKAGFSPSAHLSMPHWYFRDDELGAHEKQLALYVDLVQEEALELKQSYSDQVVPRIAQEFPNLYSYVMHEQKEGASFIAVLGARFKQSAPTLNLGVVSNEIAQKYPHHLIWARDPQRYEILIGGIRARVAAQIVSDDRTTRYLVSAQNRKIKATQALASLAQFAWVKKDRQRTVMVDSISADAAIVPSQNAISSEVLLNGIPEASANDSSFTVTVSPEQKLA
jgi:hypothetical protein